MLRRRSSPRLFFEIDDVEPLPVVVFDNVGSADVFDGTEYREAALRRHFALHNSLFDADAIHRKRAQCLCAWLKLPSLW
jgi:hypothetical protein